MSHPKVTTYSRTRHYLEIEDLTSSWLQLLRMDRDISDQRDKRIGKKSSSDCDNS
jgi:hypothetical protein